MPSAAFSYMRLGEKLVEVDFDFVFRFPEFLEGVEVADFVGHDVDHDVDVVEDAPECVGCTFAVDGFDVVLLAHFFIDIAHDSAEVRNGCSRAHDGEIGEGGGAAQVVHGDVGGFGTICGFGAGYGKFLTSHNE